MPTKAWSMSRRRSPARPTPSKTKSTPTGRRAAQSERGDAAHARQEIPLRGLSLHRVWTGGSEQQKWLVPRHRLAGRVRAGYGGDSTHKRVRVRLKRAGRVRVCTAVLAALRDRLNPAARHGAGRSRRLRRRADDILRGARRATLGRLSLRDRRTERTGRRLAPAAGISGASRGCPCRERCLARLSRSRRGRPARPSTQGAQRPRPRSRGAP